MNKNFKPVPVALDRLHINRANSTDASIWSFFIEVQLDYEPKQIFKILKDKPARVLPRRDSSYLTELANGAFTSNKGQIFYNPSDRQLDKIFNGELYGYR